jgi:hypothetical protein
MAGERLWFFQPEWIQSSLLNKYIEGGLGDRHVAPASNKSFDREPVVVRLEDPGIETEGERVLGAQLQVTFAPDAPASGRREGCAVGLNIGIRLEFER